MSQSQHREEQIPATRYLASMTQILLARAGRRLPLARRSAGMRTHMVADGAWVRQQRQGEAPEARCSPHPGMRWAPLQQRRGPPRQACWRQWGCGRAVETGGHATHKDGSTPPGGQVGGDADAVGFPQALASSGLERGWVLVVRSCTAPLPQALDGAILHSHPSSQASHPRDPLPAHPFIFLTVFLSNWGRHPCARHTSFTSSLGTPTGHTRLPEKRSPGAGRD